MIQLNFLQTREIFVNECRKLLNVSANISEQQMAKRIKPNEQITRPEFVLADFYIIQNLENL